PAAVTIPAGADSAQFTIVTTSPTENVNATITATAANAKSATLSITSASAALVQVALESPTIEGGTSVNATVVLGAPAPAGGALVTLSSSDTSLATVPATLVVPAGSTSQSFTVSTKRVGAASSVTISGVYGATHTADLALTACSALGSVAAPSNTSMKTVALEDSLPAGATATGDGTWTNTQKASGTQSILLTGAGAHAYSVSGISMTPAWTDNLVAYVLVDPCNPPKQLLVTWTSGTTTVRASWGESRISTQTHVRMGAVPEGGTWVRLETLARPVGLADQTITSVSVQTYDGQAWFDRVGVASCSLPKLAAPAADPNEVLWFDDDTPAGASILTGFNWTTDQAASGTQSFHLPAAPGWHQSVFRDAPLTLQIKPGDVITAWVLLDPCDPPLEAMLQFRAAGENDYNYRAYWGEDLIPFGADGNATRMRLGPLPAPGVWTRLEMPASLFNLEGKTLHGAAFTIWDGRAWFDRVGIVRQVNVAKGKTATQSSNFTANSTAARAVDDITNGNHAASPVAITTSEAQPWWQVDLGNVQPIDSVELWNRTDADAAMLTSVWLFVSDEPFTATSVTATRAQTGVSSYHYALGAGTTPLTFLVDRRGRYVRVQLDGTNRLQLAEVQVWAPLTPSRTNAAAGRSNGVTQVSTASGAGAERAVNGSTNPILANAQTIASTQSAANAWWELDLGSLQTINTIEVWNRLDGGNVNTNYWVFVSDVPFASQELAATLAQSGVSAYLQGSAALPGNTFHTARRGRYIRVQLAGTGAVNLGEVQVWTREASMYPLARRPGVN
ncbi:MAG: discoidin domain-containing protein, partial [Thermoanaerobaculia bacterium]